MLRPPPSSTLFPYTTLFRSSFDQHNIRYTTSTVIGEWARDKLLRYSLLTGNGDPYIWDFGSAAKHHKLYAPWLHTDHCKDRKSTRLNSSHPSISYAVFCLKK